MEKNILDFVNEDLSGMATEASERSQKLENVMKVFRMLIGDESFDGNIDTAEKLNKLISYAKAGKLPKDLFKANVAEKAADTESALSGIEPDRLDTILNADDSSGMLKNEKIVFDFASQIEDVLFQSNHGKDIFPSDRMGTSQAAIEARSFNIIPVRMIVDGVTELGIVRAPAGTVLWKKSQDKWDDMGKMEKGWGKMSPEEQKTKSKELSQKYEVLKRLQKRLPMMENEPGDWRIDHNKDVRIAVENGSLKFDDNPESKKKVTDKIIEIMGDSDLDISHSKGKVGAMDAMKKRKGLPPSKNTLEDYISIDDIKSVILANKSTDFWKLIAKLVG